MWEGENRGIHLGAQQKELDDWPLDVSAPNDLFIAVGRLDHGDDDHATTCMRSKSVIPCARTTMILVIWFTGVLCSRAQESGADNAHQVDEQAQQIDRLEQQIQKLESDIGSLRIEIQQLKQTKHQILDDSGGVGVVLGCSVYLISP